MTSRSIFTLSAADLISRSSEKYREYDADVLPLWVAEMDCALAEPIESRLLEAVRLGDTGYPMIDAELPESLAAYAADHWAWPIDPAAVRPVPDVGVGVTEVLRQNLDAGDVVAVSSPVYPPFYIWLDKIRATVRDVPLVRGDTQWSLDLDGLREAFASGAKAYVLCNPANPVGRAWRRDELAALADLAAEYGVFVVADEIHAPLALDGATFTPFLAVSDAAREVGVSVLAASKGWNIAGLKCAQIVSASELGRRRVGRIHAYTCESVGHLGQLASIVAWRSGQPWLAQAVRELSANRDLLGDLLAEHLPLARYLPPEATYLAWFDLSAYGWGDVPSKVLLDEARVALNPGPAFGATGAGWARLNFACSPSVLTEALNRIGIVAAQQLR